MSTEKMSTWLCQQIKLCKAQLYDMWCSKGWVVKAISKLGVKSCFFCPSDFSISGLLQDIGDITQWQGDMNVMFEWHEQ